MAAPQQLHPILVNYMVGNDPVRELYVEGTSIYLRDGRFPVVALTYVVETELDVDAPGFLANLRSILPPHPG